ncbi:unnamed protein product [Blepharisma stoltei]|uniref:ATP synthase F0 subunit 8 n=1 Tax=Blepharisma stoltei TaxID=1481888 RepID=A0AAU9INY0_9CILI|nr:unnamed protein product [Blepharisma stoltei]
MIFWKIIGYLKFYNTCSSLGIINECLYLSILISSLFLIYKDITHYSEKSVLLETKLRSLDRTLGNSISDSKSFSFFNDSNGILIISNELENFGDILYANQKSVEYFRLD